MQSIKKIIVITFSLSNNGAERVFAELSNQWIKQGHSVTVIQFEKDAFGSESFDLDPCVEAITLGRKKIKNKILRYILYLKDIRGYLKREKDSLVIAYSFTTQVITTIASICLPNYIIFSERNDPNNCPYSKLNRAIRNIIFHRADTIVFQTEDAKNYFSKSIQKKGTIIVNPINPMLPGMYIGKRRKVICTASRLRPQKNLTLLIEAFSLFSIDFPEYDLEIYGIGEELDKLKKLAVDKHVIDKIHFMGFCSNVNERMRDASIYVCSSDYEGISNSMLEAMGMGIPTISTDCPIGGARQVIKNGENGLLVPVGDVQALYQALKRVVEDEVLSKQISQNSYKIREKYRVDRIAERWVNYIDENKQNN